MESDDLLEKKLETQKGLFNGMIGGINENYESRFTSAEKLGMLSEKYGVPPDRLRALKADIEIMFLDEFAEKFSGIEENPPADETKEEGTQNTADSSKAGKT